MSVIFMKREFTLITTVEPEELVKTQLLLANSFKHFRIDGDDSTDYWDLGNGFILGFRLKKHKHFKTDAVIINN